MTDAPVAIVAYDPSWPEQFARGALLTEVLAPWLSGGTEHLGSTAVPGLGAKSVVDVMAGVRDLAEARAALGPLGGLGYRRWADDPTPWRLWFLKPDSARRSHHLCLVEPAHPEWAARLAFRDHLRAHPRAAKDYEALKRLLAARHRGDREAYTDAKTDFVAAVLARAGQGVGHGGSRRGS